MGNPALREVDTAPTFFTRIREDFRMHPDSGSTTGLDPNIAGALCYVLGFISGIVFLVVEKEDREVRFHAYQSLGTFLAFFVVSVAAGVVPVIGPIVSLLLTPVSVILWIVLIWKTFSGDRVELPVVGEWASTQARLP
jgi:uncharacterized membrane protein